MTFELSPEEPKPPKIAPPEPGLGAYLVTLLIILCIGGVIGWVFDGRNAGAFVGGFMINGLLISALGVLVKLPFFFDRRLVAFAGVLVMMFAGIPLAMSMEAPERASKRTVEAAAEKVAKRGTYDDVEAKPETYIAMMPTYGTAFGRGTISGTLTNSAPYAIKDMKLKCKVISETNKTLARYRPVILKRVPANGSVSFGPIDMGYVDPQAAGIYCEMVDADMIPGGAASADTASR
jgi:hypothetical protein